jgi:hypothetical protein
MSLAKNKPLLANPDIVFREEEDGAFLFDPNTGELKCLNPMGSVIWLLCDGSLTREKIENEVIGRYPQTPRDKIHDEVLTFLQDLFDMGYLGYQLSKTSPSS